MESDLAALPQNKADEVYRRRDVAQNLLDKRIFRKEGCESMRKQERIAALLRSSSRYPLDALGAEGFVKAATVKKHPKYYFYDEKYQMTFPCTPGDHRDVQATLHDIVRCFFLV